jgi:hypothetical protein
MGPARQKVNGMKRCSICGEKKENVEFYAESLKCKKCYWPAKKEKARRYWVSEHGKVARRAKHLRYKMRHPDEVRAQKAVERAVAKGKIQKGPCCRCGKTDGVQGHHSDYGNPMWIEWFCDECHKEVHRELKIMGDISGGSSPNPPRVSPSF